MGLTVLDAGVIIGFLDRSDAHHAAAHEALARAVRDNDRLVLPASAYAECLVGPSRRGPAAVAILQQLIGRLPIEVVPLDTPTAEAAARLRARHGSLKLPDALVIAAAEAIDADELITTDRAWPTRSKLGLRATITKL